MNLKDHRFFISILFLAIFLSISYAFYKYMILEDFTYFTSEEEIPSRIDINSYINYGNN
jgi:hypothetical protein